MKTIRRSTRHAEINARRRKVGLEPSCRLTAYGGHYSPFVLNDHNAWYYPSQGFDPETESLNISVSGGNWGKKTMKGCRWVRRGKIAAWGPNMDEWEVRVFPLLIDISHVRTGRRSSAATYAESVTHRTTLSFAANATTLALTVTSTRCSIPTASNAALQFHLFRDG